jgi:hypothetical protein
MPTFDPALAIAISNALIELHLVLAGTRKRYPGNHHIAGIRQ